MKRTIPFLFFFSLALALSACGSAADTTAEATLPAAQLDLQQASATPEPSPTPYTQELIDAMGRPVTIVGEPQRVISFSAPITSSFFTAGLGSLLVGRDSLSTYPQEAADIPSLGDKYDDFDVELFQSFEPDLVVADTSFPTENLVTIEQMDIPIFIFPVAASLDEVLANLSLIGSLTGQTDQVDASVEELDLRISAVQISLQDVDDRPSIFYELEASNPAAPWTYGAGTILDEVFDIAGAQNAAAGLSGTWVQLPLETLQSVDPAIILLADAAYGVSAETVAARDGWGQLSAVAEGNVIPFDETIISQPGPRIVDAIEELAEMIHPDLYP